jgi:hypothetical protein
MAEERNVPDLQKQLPACQRKRKFDLQEELGTLGSVNGEEREMEGGREGCKEREGEREGGKERGRDVRRERVGEGGELVRD